MDWVGQWHGKKISSLYRLFHMCKQAWSFWLEWLLAQPDSSLIPGFPGKLGKAWKSLEKSKENFHAFRAFPYVQKSLELLTGMISGTSWLFLDSGVSWKAWKSQEKIYHMALLALPWLWGYLESLEKPGKAKRRFTTLHSWLLLECGVCWKAWKSQEKTLRLLLGSTESNQFPGKPGTA